MEVESDDETLVENDDTPVAGLISEIERMVPTPPPVELPHSLLSPKKPARQSASRMPLGIPCKPRRPSDPRLSKSTAQRADHDREEQASGLLSLKSTPSTFIDLALEADERRKSLMDTNDGLGGVLGANDGLEGLGVLGTHDGLDGVLDPLPQDAAPAPSTIAGGAASNRSTVPESSPVDRVGVHSPLQRVVCEHGVQVEQGIEELFVMGRDIK